MNSEIESLETPLTDKHRLGRHERIALEHSEAIVRILKITQTGTLSNAVQMAVLDICRKVARADVALLVGPGEQDKRVTAASTDPRFGNMTWLDYRDIFALPRRVPDIRRLPWKGVLPKPARDYRSLLSAQVTPTIGRPMTILVLSRRVDAFSRHNGEFLCRVAGILGSALDRSRAMARNTVLSGILDGGSLHMSNSSQPEDASFMALSRDYARIATWQKQTLEITNYLLCEASADIDLAIKNALASTGRMAGSDRTYLFRLQRNRLYNTHEWTAPGIEPMMDRLQGLPVDLLDDWLLAMENRQAVEIPAVDEMDDDSAVKQLLQMQHIRSLLAVPMLRHGRLVGFVGYDSVKEARRFRSMEVDLLQSVANAINVLLDRSDFEKSNEITQQTLAIERDRLRATLAALPDLVLELDCEGRFTDYNEGGTLQPFFSPDIFLGKLAKDVLPADLHALLQQIIRIASERGRFEGTEYCLTIDGQEHWFWTSAAAKTASGDASGYVVVIRDVTLQRSQLNQIRQLGKIAELTSNLVIVTDGEGQIEWVNSAFEKRSGWRLSEVQGKKPGQFLQSTRTDRDVVRAIGEAVNNREPIQVELLNVDRYGSEYWIKKDIQPLLDLSGRLQGFVSVQTDITEIKDLHMRAMQERALAMDAAADGIAISDISGHYNYMNKAHRKMFGLAEGDDIGKICWRDLMPARTAADFIKRNWAQLLENRFWSGRLDGVRINGEQFVRSVSITKQNDGTLIWICRDITQDIADEDAQSLLREELQAAQKWETVSYIASDIAHDLSNFISIISGSIGQLADHVTADTRGLHAIRRIDLAVSSASELLQGLKRLNRRKGPRQLLDLKTIVRETCLLLGTCRIDRHQLEISMPDATCTVFADHTEFLQVMMNLAINACESCIDETGRISIEILDSSNMVIGRKPDVGKHMQDVDYSLVRIVDTGTGIESSVRSSLFRRYFTTKGDSGTGLGLQIVANIVRENNAVLWLESVPGEGTSVTVAWPSGPFGMADQPSARDSPIANA